MDTSRGAITGDFGADALIPIVIALACALLISLAATPAVKAFAKKVGAIDMPGEERRVHNRPIPRMGGLAIFLGFLLSVIIFADVNRQLQGILIGAVIVVTIGVIDDIVSLPAWVKFIFQTVAASVAVFYGGIVIESFSNPNVFSETQYLDLGWLSVPVTLFWIVAITNSVNFIDGLDGLAVGVSTISSITMLVIALVLGQGDVTIILAALTGACIGFMPYNLNPAKIFMGDTGALLLGYILSTVSILGLFKSYAIISFAVPFLILAIPLFDAAFAVFRRLLKGQKPWAPDRGHFHHRLIDMGFSQKQAVAILYLVSAILGLSAVVVTTSGEIKALLVILAFCITVVAGIFIMRKRVTNGNQSNGKPDSVSGEAVESGTPDPVTQVPIEDTPVLGVDVKLDLEQNSVGSSDENLNDRGTPE